jgi:NADH:ubiquinone oxidoreductase subunit E
MEKPEHHILVCASFRASGEPQGVCHKKGSTGFLPYIEGEILDRGMDAMVSSTGCLKVCDRGPAMVVYPENIWYGKVDILCKDATFLAKDDEFNQRSPLSG